MQCSCERFPEACFALAAAAQSPPKGCGFRGHCNWLPIHTVQGAVEPIHEDLSGNFGRALDENAIFVGVWASKHWTLPS